jgi:hypothetical protein
MKSLFKQTLLVLGTLAATVAAHASPILLTPATSAFAHEVSAANPNVSSVVSDILHTPVSLDLLYKSTQSGGAEDGSFAGSYSTAYGTLANASAVISYTGGAWINSDPVYALIKDGNLGWYLYSLNWNGTDEIDFSGYFGGNQGKISHVSLFGKNTSNRVPEGGATVALLGASIAGLGLIARRRKTV